MGEEAVKMFTILCCLQEAPKVEETKPEEPKPCPPLVLFVDLHCSGCAKKIEKSLMRIRGVEGVSIDLAKNEVSIKGIIIDPEAICAKIIKKTKRVAKVLSPLPISQLVNSQPQVGGLTLMVVELNVNMHCEACAQQLKKKILKMRGVQTASTELSTGKVVVTGTMDGNKLVEYVYRRTKKQARIVPQPEPPQIQLQAENKPPEEEKLPEQKKQDEATAPPETNTEDTNNISEEDPEQQPKPATTTTTVLEEGEPTAEMKPPGVEAKPAEGGDEIIMDDQLDHENMKRRMMTYQYYHYHPLYVIERIPPPQLFSDENPNACSIL